MLRVVHTIDGVIVNEVGASVGIDVDEGGCQILNEAGIVAVAAGSTKMGSRLVWQRSIAFVCSDRTRQSLSKVLRQAGRIPL